MDSISGSDGKVKRVSKQPIGCVEYDHVTVKALIESCYSSGVN